VLSIEQFAALRRDVEREGDLDTILRGAGLSRAEWLALERHWLGELESELATGGSPLGERYLAAYFDVAPEPMEQATPANRRALVPSFLVEPAPAIPPPPAEPCTPPDRTPAVVSDGRSTVLASPGVAGRATPFDVDVEGVHGVSLSRYASIVARSQLPGGRDASGAPSRALLAEFGLDPATHDDVVRHFDRGFARHARMAAEFGRLLTRAGQTTESASPGPSASAPDAANGGAAFPTLSVEQYAWVAATLRATPPDGMSAALARLRLTVATRDALDASWRDRLRRDPDIARAFQDAMARHPSALAEAPPSSDAGPARPVGSGTAFHPGGLANQAPLPFRDKK